MTQEQDDSAKTGNAGKFFFPYSEHGADGYRRRITVEEAEATHMVKHKDLGDAAVAFGYMHDRWLALKAEMRDGDELWAFRTDNASWANKCGREGIVLMRDDNVIESLTTKMN